MAGLGPGPLAGMMLADMGAEVVMVERKTGGLPTPDVHRRGKRSITLDLKQPADLELLLKLLEKADALFEGFRPGVMERLGAGPEVCLQRNPRLVYGRITGWGQHGPLARAAGHDINYIALTGALHAIGTREKPLPPLNLLGDYGGGAMLLLCGMLAALLEAQKSGKGQVVDAAMTDGTALLMSLFHALQAMGLWQARRESNFLDGGAHFYNTYQTKDGKFIAIGAIEPQFYALLLQKAQLDPQLFGVQHDPRKWPEQKAALQAVFSQKTRDEWCALLEGTDVCFAPVLELQEAPQHPHHAARNTYVEVDGMLQPAPAPRFSRTPCDRPAPAPKAGSHTQQVLHDWGIM